MDTGIEEGVVMNSDIFREVNEKLQMSGDLYLNDNKYNIFSVLEISNKEVIMCRMLADLLNPCGAHNRGYCYLKSFLSNVLDIKNVTNDMLEEAEVYKEFEISEKRRIDIVIKIGEKFIPIEVKIDAPEQEAQCYAYFHYAKDKMRDNDTKVYYLTKYGTMPSEYSMSYRNEAGNKFKLNKGDVVPISFKEHICNWLREIVNKENGYLKDLLEQFLNVIEVATGVVNERVVDTVKNVIIENQDNFKAALLIEESIEKAKIENIKLLFKEFEQQMNEQIGILQLTKLGKDSWYFYEKKVESFYKKQESSYPGINYLFKNVHLTDDRQLWLRIEVEDALFAGLCIVESRRDNGEYEEIADINEELKEEIKKYVKLEVIDNVGWWVKWVYVPTGKGIFDEKVPEFKNMNNVAISLVDAEIRKEFVSNAIEMIKEKLIKLVRIDT